MKFLTQSLLLIAATHVTLPVAFGDEWAQFRGPNGNGISAGKQLPITWAPDANVKWETPIPGEGWASPVVTQGKVIVSTAVSEGGKDPNSVHQWQVICLDEKTGKVLWTKTAKTAKPSIKTHRDNTYASETPVTDGERVVAYFGMTGLYCYDLDGNELWSKDLGSYQMRNDWGTSSSPVIARGMVFLQVDSEENSFVVALDVKTGEERWRQTRDEPSNWGSPVLWQNSQRTELITAGRVIRSYNPDNGELLWELNFGKSGINSSPAGNGDLLLVGHVGREGGGMYAIKAGASGDISLRDGELKNAFVAWSSDEEGPSRSSPLLYQDYVYLLGGRGGIVTCLDAKTGETVFKERIPGAGAFWASPWAYEGKVFCPDSDGNTFVLEPGRELKVLSTNKLPAEQGNRFWASSAIANGTVFIRSTNSLYAIGSE